jgi:hypothetical protein
MLPIPHYVLTFQSVLHLQTFIPDTRNAVPMYLLDVNSMRSRFYGSIHPVTRHDYLKVALLTPFHELACERNNILRILSIGRHDIDSDRHQIHLTGRHSG